MARAANVVEMAHECVSCTRTLAADGEKMCILKCCGRGIHQACLRQHYPDETLLTCPKCRCRTQVRGEVIQRDTFSPEESDKIELCFLKHHVIKGVPMTKIEIQGLRLALNVNGFRAMRHVSRRIFVLGLPFWFPMPKDKLCDWEDIAARLSLGLLWNMVSEMRDRYKVRVQRDNGRGDTFHHLVDHLLEVSEEDNELPMRDAVVKTCCDVACVECQGFANVFHEPRLGFAMCLANRSYLYDRVEPGMYNQFASLMRKKNGKR